VSCLTIIHWAFKPQCVLRSLSSLTWMLCFGGALSLVLFLRPLCFDLFIFIFVSKLTAFGSSSPMLHILNWIDLLHSWLCVAQRPATVNSAWLHLHLFVGWAKIVKKLEMSHAFFLSILNSILSSYLLNS